VNRTEFVARWSERLHAYRTIPAFVNAERLCEEVLADFAQMCRGKMKAVLSLHEAAAESDIRATTCGDWCGSAGCPPIDADASVVPHRRLASKTGHG